MRSKPKKCPECGTSRIAEIFYGLPALDEQMERDLDARKIVLGGCCVSDDSPEWHCNECKHEWETIARKYG